MRDLSIVFAAAVPLCSPIAAQEQPIEARVREALDAVNAARIEASVRALAGFGTRHVLSRTDSRTEGTGAARAWLKAQYEAIARETGGRLRVELQESLVPCRRRGMPEKLGIVNVIATLPGTAKDGRTYVVGGHYDSRNGDSADGRGPAPGANDDGSGTAVTLEVCRVLSRSSFPATLVFAAHDGEEQGLLGSTEHARALAEAGVAVDGMIECDIVGNTLGMDGVVRDGYVRCFSYAASGNDSLGRSLARAMTFAARRHVPGFEVKLVLRGDRYGRGGDHRPFFERGFPAVRCSEAREDYSRQHVLPTKRGGKPYGDVPEYADCSYAANVARVVVATLAELASAPPPPRAFAASGARDRYDTFLEFSLPEGVDDYEFVWRETTAADWQGVIARRDAVVERTRRGLDARLKGLVVDDVVVGVRSIGRDGSRSRVATPPEPDRFDNAGAKR
ncbi:MAG: M20/M25/M40 family metallo-hydrolase [Planctomycetota bacterium]